jgi:4-alpha-glucanotransferase
VTDDHPLARRRAGVVCHVTSLPTIGGPGTLGADAFAFVEFLARAGLSLWQVLPLNPPDPHGSPYQSASLSACSTALTDAAEVERAGGVAGFVDRHAADYAEFRDRHAGWLDDFATFVVASRHHGSSWWRWPIALRERDPAALATFAREHRRAIEAVRSRQYVVFAQWSRLRRVADARGVVLIGDMPLYPALASADVWAHRAYFQLDAAGEPTAIAGVPPDYFSATGQLWGNPVYDWDRLAADGYRWWLDRLEVQLALFDVVRIDHFRGLEAYWSVPAGAPDATGGHWCAAPGGSLLDAVRARFPGMPLIAEDLGLITPAVEALRDAYALPGMRVLQFAFSGDPHNPHLPEHYVPHLLAYSGTHDNDTTLGWYRGLDARTRTAVDGYLGGGPAMPWAAIERVYASCANSALAPMQDYLALGSAARMNTPGVAAGNWRWQIAAGQLTDALAAQIHRAAAASGRLR